MNARHVWTLRGHFSFRSSRLGDRLSTGRKQPEADLDQPTQTVCKVRVISPVQYCGLRVFVPAQASLTVVVL
jgi:hypothetical protein